MGCKKTYETPNVIVRAKSYRSVLLLSEQTAWDSDGDNVFNVDGVGGGV